MATSATQTSRRDFARHYSNMQKRLDVPVEEMSFVEKLRSLFGPGDWRFPAATRWTDDHRRLALAMLATGSRSRTGTELCQALRAEMGHLLERFKVIKEPGGCRVHYVYGENYLWPSKVRIVDNPTDDWWLPATN